MDQVVNKLGMMKKRPADMSEKELSSWKKDTFARARAYLFSIGQPLVYRKKDGTAVAEYPDGRIEPVL